MSAHDIVIRPIEPSDYPYIASVVNDWWSGRNVVEMLPKLFFIHFRDTSFVAEREGNAVGFLIGFVSQTIKTEAYIHFAGVHPNHRKRHIGHQLYQHFFDAVNKRGCSIARCITSPVNKGSIAFHLREGFSIEPSDKQVDGIPVAENYDGKGGDRVLFYKAITG